MIPNGLITYSPLEIERKAEAFLRSRPELGSIPPVDIELLIEGMPDTVLEVQHGICLHHSVEAASCKRFMQREKVVLIDESILARGTWARYNAALAEELAHILLHAALFDFVESIEDFVDLQEDPQWGMYEKDARLMSRSLRMPAPAVRLAVATEYNRATNRLGFGSYDRVLSNMTEHLAKLFKVYPKEMHERILSSYCNVQSEMIRAFSSCENRLRISPVYKRDQTITDSQMYGN